jgi:hypothetical protein
VWEILNPKEEDHRDLIEEPEMPEFKDFGAGTSIYTELNIAERKEYNIVYRIFKGQIKLF